MGRHTSGPVLFFVLTKILFFLAIVSVAATFLDDFRWIACTATGIALSPFFSKKTPFGASDFINFVQTHTSLAIALIMWANFLLLRKRWLGAAVLLSACFYINALFALYNLFVAAGFTVLDWKEHRGRIVSAGLCMTVLVMPWFIFSQGKLPSAFPEDFFETLLLFYPYHVAKATPCPTGS